MFIDRDGCGAYMLSVRLNQDAQQFHENELTVIYQLLSLRWFRACHLGKVGYAYSSESSDSRLYRELRATG